MKEVTLHIPDNKYRFFMELIKSLRFIKIPEAMNLIQNQLEFVEGTKKSME